MIEVDVVQGSNLKARIEPPELAREMPLGEEPSAGSLVIKMILSAYGDKRFSWNPMNLAEIRDAEAFYLKCLAQGLLPFRVGKDGKTVGPMPEFEPGAGMAAFLTVAEANESIAMLPIKRVAGG